VFQIVIEREERASIAIATNRPSGNGSSVFPDPGLVAAFVDRVTFNVHILETGTQSYQVRASKRTRCRPRLTKSDRCPNVGGRARRRTGGW
jgi:hypothetical protein